MERLNTAVPGWMFVAIVLSYVPRDLMYGPMAALIAECFPARLRYSGCSLGYQLGAVIAGDPAPLIATALLAAFGSAYAVARLHSFLRDRQHHRNGFAAGLHEPRHLRRRRLAGLIEGITITARGYVEAGLQDSIHRHDFPGITISLPILEMFRRRARNCSAPSQKLHLLLVRHFIGTGKVAEGDDWATHWVTVGAMQEKVGVSVDRSQNYIQDCGLAKRLVAAIPG